MKELLTISCNNFIEQMLRQAQHDIRSTLNFVMQKNSFVTLSLSKSQASHSYFKF